ncbi:MAG: ATP-binding protein [Planctomycetota bacterium]
MTIARQLRRLAVGLVVATAMLVGITTWSSYGEIVTHEQRVDVSLRARGAALRLQASTQELAHDVQMLSALPMVQELGSAPDDPALRTQLAELFRVVMAAKPHYRQLRLIGRADQGRELVRVERVGDDFARTPDEQLQPKAQRDYFVEAFAMPPGALYVSRVDLNREHGQIERPHHPTLRAGAVIANLTGQSFALLMVNVDFERLVTDLFGPPPREVRIANAEGDWLVHPDPDRTFGFDLGRRHRLQDDMPSLDGKLTGDVDLVGGPVPGQDELMYFARVRLPGPPRDLWLGLSRPSIAGSEALAAIAWNAVGWTAVLLLLAAGIAWRLAARLARPLGSLSAAADQIAAGRDAVQLPTARDDEIGHLARAFDRMLRHLRAHAARLARANEDLEHFAHIAAHELTEPARRLAGVADLVRLNLDDVDHGGGGGPALAIAETRHLLDALQEAAGQMLERLDTLRVFAGVAPGSLTREPAALRPVVDDVLAEFGDRLAGVPVQIDELPELECYRHLVAVVYRNLIDNALRHGDRARPMLWLTARRTPGGWVLGVQNRGASLTPEQLTAVFAPIYRLVGGTADQGIGLAVCRRVVERHHGRIWAESDADSLHIQFTLDDPEHADHEQHGDDRTDPDGRRQ